MERMKRTNIKECPKCKSKNVFDIGGRFGKGGSLLPGAEIAEPNQPVYECKDCGELFIYIGENSYKN